MVTKDPVKNLEYVKKSQARKKEALGLIEYNRINADTEQKHRDKLKTKIGEEKYKRQQAEYMKEYRAKQRQLKKELDQKQKSVNTLTDAIKARKARNEAQRLRISKANETAQVFEEQMRGIKDKFNDVREVINQVKKRHNF